MSLNKFFSNFLIFTGILGLAAYFLEAMDESQQVLIPHFWLIFAALFLLTSGAYLISWYGIKTGGETSIYMIMAAIVGKLLFCLVLVLVYVLKIKVSAFSFALNFFSLYFLFTAFEVYALLRNLRHQNKT